MEGVVACFIREAESQVTSDVEGRVGQRELDDEARVGLRLAQKTDILQTQPVIAFDVTKAIPVGKKRNMNGTYSV